MLKKLISVCFFIALIVVTFIAGYKIAISYNSSNISNLGANIARWSFESETSEKIINLSESKIYPGSNGQFEIDVNAEGSDVEVEYEILVRSEKNIPTNMIFFAETKNGKGGVISKTQEYSSFTELASNELKGKIPVEKDNQKRKINVYWNWKFNENDTSSFIDVQDATLKYDENRKFIFRVLYRYRNSW